MAGLHERFVAKLPLSVLRAVAKRLGIEGSDEMDREALIEQLRSVPLQRAASVGQSLRRLAGRLPCGVLRSATLSAPPRPAARRDDRPPTPPAVPGEGPATGEARELQFDTTSMADLLLRQGYVEEARAMLQRIVERHPDNRAARERLDEIQQGLPRRRQLATHHAPVPPRTPGAGAPRAPRVDEPVFRPSSEQAGRALDLPDVEELPFGYGRVYARLLHVEPTTLYAYWEVTPASVEAVRRRMGDPHGALTLRLVSHYVEDRGGGVVRDVEVENLVGDYSFVGLKPGGRHRLAVGVRSKSGLFEPICHTALAATAPAGPSGDTRETWLEVEPPELVAKPLVQPIRIIAHATGSAAEALRTRTLRLGLDSLPEQIRERILRRLHQLLQTLGRPGALPTSPGLTRPDPMARP